MIRRSFGYLFPHEDEAPAASRELEENGCVVIHGVLTPQETEALAAEITAVFETEPSDRRAERPAEVDDMFRYAMLNRSPLSQQAIAHPRILEVIEPLLGDDCHIIANTAWRNPPHTNGDHGGAGWHIDAGPHIPLPPGTSWPKDIPHPVFAIGAHIFLEPCGMDEGPTGAIPGSHLSGQTPPLDRRQDDDLAYQGQGVVPLLADAGDVAFFVSDVWHRRMPSQPGDRGRFFLQAHYGRRDIAQRLETTAEVNQLSDAAIARAETPRAQTMIGLHKPFFYDG